MHSWAPSTKVVPYWSLLLALVGGDKVVADRDTLGAGSGWGGTEVPELRVNTILPLK